MSYYLRIGNNRTKSITTNNVTHVRNTSELGSILRDSRRAQAITISDTSDFVSVGKRFISEIERGKQTALFGKVLEYLTQLGLSLHIYPKNVLGIAPPYGALNDIKAIGALARHHRKEQKATLNTVQEISGLSLRFLSDFERGNNSQIGKVLTALSTYGLDVFVSPGSYRLSKADLING